MRQSLRAFFDRHTYGMIIAHTVFVAGMIATAIAFIR